MFELLETTTDRAVLTVVNTDTQSSQTLKQMQKMIKELNFLIDKLHPTSSDIAHISADIHHSDMIIIITDLNNQKSLELCLSIAKIAREYEVLSVIIGIVPKQLPEAEQEALTVIHAKDLVKHVDSLLFVSETNSVLKQPCFNDIVYIEDNVLIQAILGITEIVYKPGLIRVDFSDVRTVLFDSGIAKTGFGMAEGENRATVATERAFSSQALRTVDLSTVETILVTIRSGLDLAITEFEVIVNMIRSMVSAECMVVAGTAIKPEMTDTIQVIIVYTGITV